MMLGEEAKGNGREERSLLTMRFRRRCRRLAALGPYVVRRFRSKGDAPRRCHHGPREIFHNRLSDDACVIRE